MVATVDSNTVTAGPLKCLYSSISANRCSGCTSVISLVQDNPPSIQNVVAFGADCSICLAKETGDSLKFEIVQTIFGHKASVRCLTWIRCCTLDQYSTQLGAFLIAVDSTGLVILWYFSTDDLMSLTVNTFYSAGSIVKQFQLGDGLFNVSSVDGYFKLDADNKVTLVFCVAYDHRIQTWSTDLQLDCLSQCHFVDRGLIWCKPALGLCLTIFGFKLGLQVDSKWLNVICIGLDNGLVEIWSNWMTDDQTEWTYTKSVCLSGHQDWVRCMDVCLDWSGSAIRSAMIASGSQDNFIRLWRLVSTPDGGDERDGVGQSVLKFKLPDSLHSSSTTLHVALESVLAGHDNWVTGVCWAPPTNVFHLSTFPPPLVSSSTDKSLIIWFPPDQPAAGDGQLWLQKARLGNFSDTGIGFFDCLWMHGNDGCKVLGQNFQGSFSIWNHSAESESWHPILPTTGHFGPVSDLSWMKLPATENKYVDIDTDRFIYLLTAGKDQTVRLHTCHLDLDKNSETFWFEIGRPQIHGYDMNAVASISPTSYVSAGDEKVGRVFAPTQTFVHMFDVERRLPGGQHLISFDTVAKGAVQPSLGLSNQATRCDDSENTSETVNNRCFQTEDKLQHATLWPEVKKLYGHPYEIYCLAAHPFKPLVATACSASKPEFTVIILWDGSSDWSIHQRLDHHQLTVTQLVWSHDGCQLLACSRDRTWSLWSEDNATDRQYRLAAYPTKGQSHSRIIWTCAWSTCDKYFFTGSRDTCIYIWSVPPQRDPTLNDDSHKGLDRLSMFKDAGEPITALDTCASSGLSLLLVGLESGRLALIHVTTTPSSSNVVWTPVYNLFPVHWMHVPCRRLRRVAFESDRLQTEIRFATCADDGLVRIFELDRRQWM